jgi:hypothetical protein
MGEAGIATAFDEIWGIMKFLLAQM